MTARDPDRRNKIIEVARKIFAKHGYDGASISMIAVESGLTKAALYHHFESKEDIFRASALVGIDELINEVEVALENTGADPVDRLRTFMLATANRFDKKQDSWAIGATIFWEAQILSPRAEVVERRDYYESLLKSLISDCLSSGDFREDLDVSLTSKFLMSVINQLPRWYRKEGRYNAMEIVSIYLNMLLSGMIRDSKI